MIAFALLGMSAYFVGRVQAPLTAVMAAAVVGGS